MNATDAALICKALSDTNRLQIVQLLTEGEQCTCHLLEHFQITQPTLTHHMRVLSECDLLQSRKDGKWTFYSLNCGTLTVFREFIAGLDCNKNGGRAAPCYCSPTAQNTGSQKIKGGTYHENNEDL